MGRPRTPTAMNEASGTYEKNPARKKTRANEPKPNRPIGGPPEVANTAPGKIWYEILDSIPPGVVFDSDRMHLQILCHLISQFRLDPVDFPASKLTIINTMLAKLGMNPADRSRVVAEQASDDSPEDEFFN